MKGTPLGWGGEGTKNPRKRKEKKDFQGFMGEEGGLSP